MEIVRAPRLRARPTSPTSTAWAQRLDRLLASIDAAANARWGCCSICQLNERAYVVSVVATIFVPLTFVTWLLRHELGWMVDHITAQIAFFCSIVLPLATALAFWRRTLRRAHQRRRLSAKLGSSPGRRQQPHKAGAADGLAAAVGIELGVDVAQVGADVVRRDAGSAAISVALRLLRYSAARAARRR